MTSPPEPTFTLFAYGSLREPAVQQWLFGRWVTAEPDVLPGACCHWVDDLDPDLFRLTGQRGYPALQLGDDPATAVLGERLMLSAAELTRADAYEGKSYRRQRVQLQSGQHAWVYVEASLRHRQKKTPPG